MRLREDWEEMAEAATVFGLVKKGAAVLGLRKKGVIVGLEKRACLAAGWRENSKPGGRLFGLFLAERKKEMGLWCGGQKFQAEVLATILFRQVGEGCAGFRRKGSDYFLG